jgi:phosphatidylglycerophosphatase C
MAHTAISVYDFDHTIYDGDASLDFYLFCLRRSPWLLTYLPYQLWHALLFVLRLEDRGVFKGNFFIFLRSVKQVDHRVAVFWEGHFNRLKDWYVENDHSRDVIISASPEFLLAPVAAKLKVYALIATRVDTKTGHLNGENCRGAEKVVRLRQTFPNESIDKVYTDSRSDAPLLALGARQFLVKGNKITELKSATG